MCLICSEYSSLRNWACFPRNSANERAAAACGVNGAAVKLQVFAFSSFLAGLGGAMMAYLRGQISGESFSVFASLALLAFAYLGASVQ